VTVVGPLLLVVLAVVPGLALLVGAAWERRGDEEP